MAEMHAAFEPAPISPRKPFRLFCLSHWVAAWRRSAPMVEETQVGEVPEPSESRYWCISIATLLFGSLIAPKTSLLPEEVQVQAPVQLVPSTRMSCEVAPEERTPLMPACICGETGQWLLQMLQAEEREKSYQVEDGLSGDIVRLVLEVEDNVAVRFLG